MTSSRQRKHGGGGASGGMGREGIPLLSGWRNVLVLALSQALALSCAVLAMFVPSFFSGALVRRFGAIEILLAGLALLAVHVLIAASGTELANFLGALVLLGVGWNFTYVAGTALLTEAYAEEERAKTQAANELILQSFVALASLASGWLLAEFGWRVLALSALPPSQSPRPPADCSCSAANSSCAFACPERLNPRRNPRPDGPRNCDLLQ